jgi:hypothetical protein
LTRDWLLVPAIGARAAAQQPVSDFIRYQPHAGHVHEITVADIMASDERRAKKTLLILF